jgi:hypothetical protein
MGQKIKLTQEDAAMVKSYLLAMHHIATLTVAPLIERAIDALVVQQNESSAASADEHPRASAKQREVT